MYCTSVQWGFLKYIESIMVEIAHWKAGDLNIIEDYIVKDHGTWRYFMTAFVGRAGTLQSLFLFDIYSNNLGHSILVSITMCLSFFSRIKWKTSKFLLRRQQMAFGLRGVSALKSASCSFWNASYFHCILNSHRTCPAHSAAIFSASCYVCSGIFSFPLFLSQKSVKWNDESICLIPKETYD